MSPEEIIEHEKIRFGEWLEMLPIEQQSAFLVSVLAHRCNSNELMIDYLKKRLNRLDNGLKTKELSDKNG